MLKISCILFNYAYQARDRTEARTELEGTVYQLKNELKDPKAFSGALLESEKQILKLAMENEIKWLDNPKNNDASTKDLKERISRINDMVKTYMESARMRTMYEKKKNNEDHAGRQNQENDGKTDKTEL